jgi:hypothetical protein
MRSLLLVESFDFRPSNQYILVRVIPSCFRFVKIVFVAGKSPVKGQSSAFWLRSESKENWLTVLRNGDMNCFLGDK